MPRHPGEPAPLTPPADDLPTGDLPAEDLPTGDLPVDDGPEPAGRAARRDPERRCIVGRTSQPRASLIRFVVDPDGVVIPDLKARLPGRGAWVTAERGLVDAAVRRKLFARAFRRSVTVPDDLASSVDRLLAQDALGVLGLARRAGRLVLGATKVAELVKSGRAAAVLTASDAAADGRDRMTALRRAAAPDLPAWSLFTSAEMSLAFGGGNVIHAALQSGHETRSAVDRLARLAAFRGPDTDTADTALASAGSPVS